MPTVQEIAEKLNRQVADSLIRNVEAMPADRREWKPLDAGRSALSQVQECATINLVIAAAVRERAVPQDFSGAYAKFMQDVESAESPATALAESAEALATAIRAIPDDALGTSMKLPWDVNPTTLAEILFVPYWNNAYHLGQISYVQTLYGDNEMH